MLSGIDAMTSTKGTDLARGFGIGIIGGKHHGNVGSLLRTAFNFGASFVFTVGQRYSGSSFDTQKAHRTVPLFQLSTIGELASLMPYEWPRICIELGDDCGDLRHFSHPRNCVYILGPEDGDVPQDIQDTCASKVMIPTLHCLDVGVAAGVVLYDRMIERAHQRALKKRNLEKRTLALAQEGNSDG